MQHARLVREPLDCLLAPGDVLRALRSDRRPFALTGDWAGGGAILGSEPVVSAPADAGPFAVVDIQSQVDGERPRDAVGGGWFGRLSYGAGAMVEDLSPYPPRPVPAPVASWAFYDHVLRQDPAGRWWFEALETDSRSEALAERAEELRTRLASVPARADFAATPFAPYPGETGYRRAVEVCLGHIAAGDLYQANLALRLEAGFRGSALDAYAEAIASLHPARAAYIGDPGHELVSLSPELFLSRHGREVLSAPIKGTRPRTDDPEQANAAAEELRGSVKDRAENVMIVDLMRNDLGRVCDFGSVSADLATEPEAHPGVWHMVATVRGRLSPGVTDSALLRAAFPPGSVTGAPKIKAQEVITELECTAREAYTGAIGFASPVAGLELNVAIRTFEVSGGRVWLGVGAGIVADSDPASEYAETLAKAAPLVDAIGSRIDEPPERAPGTPPRPVRLPRPDPAAGLVETLLVCDGVPCEIDGHLARLGASAAELYGRDLDLAAIAARIRAEAPGEGRARARILVAASGSADPLVSVDPEADLAPAPPVTLVPATVPGGLGPHKWADRALVGALAGAPGHEALICDIDGAVLETGAGNIWAVRDGVLVTPPLDGRALPGVTRDVLVELAAADGIEVAEEHLDLAALEAADELLVTSAIRGVAGARLAGSAGPTRDALASSLVWRMDARRRQVAVARTTS